MHVQALVLVLALLFGRCRSWTGVTPTTHNKRKMYGYRLLGMDSSMTTSTRLYYTTNVTSDAFLSTSSSSHRERTRHNNETIIFDEFGMAKAGNDLEDLLLLSTTSLSSSSPPRSRSSRSAMRSSDQPSRGSPQRHHPQAPEKSVYHAIEQVHAIMDIYTVSNHAISSDMITSTLGGVIQTVYREKTHITVRGSFGNNDNNNNNNNNNTILHELEGLVWRLGELNIPLDSIMALKAMLSMQRHKYGAESLESKRAYIDRAAKLLLFYCQGGSNRQRDQLLVEKEDLLDKQRQGDRISSSPTMSSFLWPREDVREVLDFAKANKAGMTPHLWDLFQHLSAHDPLEAFVRDVTSDTLYILNHSGEEWSDQSERILMDLEDRYRITNNTLFSARPDELDLSLTTAATLGRAQHATWLFRKLHKGKQLSPLDRKKLWYRLLTAYSQSNSVGSVSYMERLVLSQEETQCTEIFNIVLQAIAMKRTPGSGLRAEKFLNQTLALSLEATPYHNMESLRFCVKAYLDEEPRVLENVVNADALVRRLVSSTNESGPGIALYHPDDSGDTDGGVFERLLEAYVSLAPTQPKVILKHAESLVRFFLLHHRDGKISEKPSARHLDYILTILKQIPSKRNNEKRRELVSIFEKITTTKGGVV